MEETTGIERAAQNDLHADLESWHHPGRHRPLALRRLLEGPPLLDSAAAAHAAVPGVCFGAELQNRHHKRRLNRGSSASPTIPDWSCRP